MTFFAQQPSLPVASSATERLWDQSHADPTEGAAAAVRHESHAHAAPLSQHFTGLLPNHSVFLSVLSQWFVNLSISVSVCGVCGGGHYRTQQSHVLSSLPTHESLHQLPCTAKRDRTALQPEQTFNEFITH